MIKPIKTGVREHFQQKQLTARQLEQLQHLQSSYNGSPAQPIIARKRVKMLALVASILVILWLTPPLLWQHLSGSALEQRIAEEVASNHLKLKPLETAAGSMDGIAAYFKQLDFLPVEPAFFDSGQYALMGGRYCSIQGVTAAQLRIQNKQTGTMQSLYETQYDPAIFKQLPILEKGAQPLSIYAKGMEVKIWVEKDILFALTGVEPAANEKADQ